MPAPRASLPDAAVLADLRARLEVRRAEVAAEIRGYPPPIPACDQHYNHLLERRHGLAQALRALELLREDGGPESLRALLGAPAFESEPELRAELADLLT